MRVLVDTSVWSLALRRKAADLNPEERQIVVEWSDLVRDGRVQIIGPIRQEILSGIRDRGQFEALQRRLSAFPDTQIKTADYVQAARFFNLCRKEGVTGAPIDLLICAVAHRFGWPIFSRDDDFNRYAGLLPVRLHKAAPVER